MTTFQHPITPPPKLVKEWLGEYFGCEVTGEVNASELHLATRAAQWGADQELEACVEWISNQDWTWTAAQLRAARRPKPPSLAEKALDELGSVTTAFRIGYGGDLACDTIRRALERLQQLEKQQ